MVILQAIILGIIEGLTEFLPISSTGHLVVAERAMGYRDTAEVFTVVIQLGAIAAVIWHYRQDLIGKFSGLIKRNKEVMMFWKLWVCATIPAALTGLIFSKKLDTFVTPRAVAVSLILGGVLMWLIETLHKPKKSYPQPQLEKLSLIQVIKIGCYQVLALIPGVSRSGATIMGGLLSGVDRVTATAFSFYLSIPILVLAGGYKLVADADKIGQVSGGSAGLLAGTIAAFISGLLVVNWLLKYIARHDFKIFAYYRILAGIFILSVLAIF